MALSAASCGETERDYSQTASLDAAIDASLIDTSLSGDAQVNSSNGNASSNSNDVATLTVDVTGEDTSTLDAGSPESDGSVDNPTNSDAPDASSSVTTAHSNGSTTPAQLDSGVGSSDEDADETDSPSSDTPAHADGGDVGSDTTVDTSSNETLVVSESDAGTDAGVDSGNTGSSSSDSGSAVEPVVVTIDASGADNLVGYPIVVSAAAEASDGSELSYAWAFESVPEGSTVDAGSFQGEGAEVSFHPDLAGEYVIRVTASAGDAATTIDVNVAASAYDIGYLNVAGDVDSWTRAGFMVRSDGTNNRQVGCYFPSAAESEAAWLKEFVSLNQFGFQAYLPKDESAVARFAYNYEDDLGNTQMYIAGEQSDCDTSPPAQVVGGMLPVFTPSGQRLSVITETVVDGAGTTQNLVTHDVTGTDTRTIRTGATDLVGVSWPDDDTLLWTELGEYARVYKAPDIDGVFENDLLTQVVLDCDVVENPLSIWGKPVERNGQLFVWVIGSPLAIWRLDEVAGGAYDCSADALTNQRVVADNVIDFDVSPDGRSLLYYVRYAGVEGEPGYTTLFLRNLGDEAAMVLSSEPNTIASGAHFAMDGRQVVWTETRQTVVVVDETNSYERPAESRLMIANSDGQDARVLTSVSSTPTQVRAVHTGANTFLPTIECSVGHPLGAKSGGGYAGVALALVGLFGRRRLSKRFKPLRACSHR